MTSSADESISRETPPSPASQPYRCGYVALAGRPNVGKSTLLNRLVGEHLSIVSPKPQTTRERVSGVLTRDRYQIIFLDAPGLLEPEYPLQEAMRLEADRAIDDADVVALICDPTRRDTFPEESLVDGLKSRGKPPIIVFNKADLVPRETLAGIIADWAAEGYRAVSLSALSGEGVDAFTDLLVDRLPVSPPLYPPEFTAVQPLRFFAEEFVREACLELFREEVPHSIICRVEEFREHQDPVYILVNIYVERESQKGIVIGEGGRAIKAVGTSARKRIEQLLGRRVYLELRVKVLPRWTRKRGKLRSLGFRLPPRPRRRR